MYIYVYSSFFMIGFYINNKPLIHKSLFYMEIVNEVFVLLTSYYLFMFTEFVPEVETRYTIGFFYTPNLMGVAAINMVLVFIDIIFSVKTGCRKNRYEKEWVRYHRIKGKMIVMTL